MKSSCKYALKVLLELLHTGFVLVGLFLLGCVLLVLGIGVYLWMEEPERLAMVRPTYQIINPQPLQVSPAETNVWMPELPVGAYINGVPTNAAIWANGKAFKSGGRAAWELVRGAWRLWLLGAGTLICGLLLRRYGSALKTRSEWRINIPEPGAPPNGGPAVSSGKSGATEGPPSVS